MKYMQMSYVNLLYLNYQCLKILIIGDTGVGKASLLLKYCYGGIPESHMATIGIDFRDKIINLNGKEVKLQIWGTSGQERFRSITKNFYRNADGVIFVFDVTHKESFSHIKEWLFDTQLEDSGIKKILVGNKVDLVNDRVISKEKMKNFAENKKMKAFETSAKEGYNVDNIFTEIASLILANKTDNEMNELFSKNTRNSICLNNSKRKRKKKCC